MEKILYYDCFAGISGDMNLGALIDLGVDEGFLSSELAKLNIPGFKLEVLKDIRKGISGTKATIVIDNPENEKHRHLRHVEEIVNNSPLPDEVKITALNIFRRIAEAEAKVHNISIEKVHFHEVGALDSIADIVGAAVCLHALKVDKVLSSSIQLGGGMVKCAHGLFPVPAPATSLILEHIPVKTGLIQHEATTPTGAAILAETVSAFVLQCDFKVIKTGYGIGQRDTDVPNVLRVYLAESEEKAEYDFIVEEGTMLECNIDDMNPEWFEHLSNVLFKAGASEVYATPVIMKKTRGAQVISVLCKNELANTLKPLIFKHTTTIGLREYNIKKSMLKRSETIIKTMFGNIRVKQSFMNNKIVHAKPEYDDLKTLAMKHKLPIQTIYNEAIKHL